MSTHGALELTDLARTKVLPIMVVVEDLSQDVDAHDVELDHTRLVPPVVHSRAKARAVRRRASNQHADNVDHSMEEAVGLIANDSEATLLEFAVFKVPMAKHSKTQRHERLHALKGSLAVCLFCMYILLVTIQLLNLNQAAKPVVLVSSRENCTVAPNLRRLEPPRVFFGASLDWQVDKPSDFKIPIPLSVFGGFVKMDARGFQADMALWYAQQVAKLHKRQISTPVLLLSLMPTVSLDKLSVNVLVEFAWLCRRINYELGVPLMIRFAHEMNGNWDPYGQRPLQFVETWQTLTFHIRRATNMTAMLWAPNMGVGYPYSATEYSLQTSESQELAALDTNGNGVLDVGDDPYTPYFPGRDWVDWIGLSIYWFGAQGMVNSVPPSNQFVSILRGTSLNSQTMQQPIWDFVEMFPNLPIAIPETGAAWYLIGNDSVTEVEVKRAWWEQVFVSRPWITIPRLKLVQFFEERKVEERGLVDYRVMTGSSSLANEFAVQAVQGVNQDLMGIQTVYCNGTV